MFSMQSDLLILTEQLLIQCLALNSGKVAAADVNDSFLVPAKILAGLRFDRPLVHFAKRLRILGQRLDQIKDVHLRGQWRDNIPLFKLSCELQKISADKSLLSTLEAPDLKSEVFDQLRGAMRIAQAKPRA